MDKLKIKFATEKVEFEIEAENIENGDKDFLEKLVGLFNNKASVCCSPTEHYITKDLPNESQLTDTKESSETIVEDETKKEQSNSVQQTEKDQTDSAEENKNIIEVPEEVEETKEQNVVEEEQSTDVADRPFPPSIDLLGVKVRKDQTYGYQTYYICPMCKNKGKRFAGQYDKFVFCHTCNFRMHKKDATSVGFPEKDSYGNYFVAGDFIPVGLDFKE
ncbi:hypothetical protein [Bacillus toyonensis]|uniref:hypothetical protein n=1 Tax=Bacillus toyonensis TaxID=155322 RepID=UPI002E234042|nr:hypothetical protein [Bacillus toyonensis]